jgi:hypothetical protein
MPYTYNPLLKVGLDQTGSGGGGGTPGGSTTQVQFNDGGAFGGDADLTWNKTTNVLGVTGDVNLSDGGTYTTTLQTITPTAARTISLPDATGTVALVAGSSGQVLWNNAGVNAGASTLTYDGSILTTSGRFINSYNATASAPAKAFTGTWFTGGTGTTTKPQVLIEPTGTTSTGWSTSGTGLGVNAASGFAGNLLDLQVNGTSQASISGTGEVRGATLRAGSDSGKGVISYSTNTLNLNAAGSVAFRLSNRDWFNETWDAGTPWVLGSLLNEAGNTNRAGTPIRLQPRGGSGNGAVAHLQLYTGLAAASGTSGHTSELCIRTILPASGQPGLAFGGITSSFSSIKRNAATLETRLADDSDYALHAASVFQAAKAHTVATLPGTPAVGMIARVTDATAPVVGMTVAGGGAAAALVWYNGTNWSVIGV